MEITDEYRNKIELLCGDDGKKWLSSLPDQVYYYEQKWNIKTSGPYPLSYNYVCPAINSDGQKAVLKLSFPNNHEFKTEIAALKRFPEEVAIQILEEDLEKGSVLLEQAIPGSPVAKITPDENQIHFVSQVVKKLHKPIDERDKNLFPSVADWAKIFDRYIEKDLNSSGLVPRDLVDLGKGILTEFLQEEKEQCLLHGDLHNDNILQSNRGWLVIDPKGLVGEREFELGAYLRNPYYDLPQNSDYPAIETRRIIQFADELGFDRERIRLWALACTIISMLWFWEDEGKVSETYLRSAELIRSIKI